MISINTSSNSVIRRVGSATGNSPAVLAFSWAVDDLSGNGQSAYRILLARSREALAARKTMWDTGRVDSTRSIDVPYDGPSLAPETTYYWMGKVWNDSGDASEFSPPATFSTAPSDAWSGQWIARQPDTGDSNGYRSRWRSPSFESASESKSESESEWVQIDLGSVREFARVVLYPAEPFDGATTPDGRQITASDIEDEYLDATVAQGPVAFGFPDRYRIEFSNDPSFEDAYTVIDRMDADVPDPHRDPVIHDIETVTARYVRVTATVLDEFHPDASRLREEHRPWTVFALAALAVRDETGVDLALECPVTASSSVETDAWGSARLTDGEYASTATGGFPLFRTEFELTKPVARARAHFVGLGYGELHVNGKTVGDAVLDPGWTQYDERVLYATYDLESQLRDGLNAVGIWLGRGWFGRSARHWTAFGSPRARLRLTVEYEDGTTRELVTDGNWRTAQSPIIENDIYDGETYDARLEQDGWTTPGFDDSEWESVAVVNGPAGTLYPQQVQPIEVTERLDPVAVFDHENGPIVDFGQNHTGWIVLDIAGGTPGDEVVIRHAEALDEEGNLQTVDLRSADATDTYVIGNDGGRTYEPRFTYHGYRYVQIEGYPDEFTAANVRSAVVHTAMDVGGEFACSNEDLTAVQRNARWGLRSNAHSVPTDCPQRDERMGFSGDGHLASRALQYNFDAVRFHEKWVRDHSDTQSQHGYVPGKFPFGAVPSMTDPSWTVSLLAIPWHLYRRYGDEGVLERHYETMRRYIDFWDSVADDHLLPDEYSGYGDWVALENADGRTGKPTDLFTNAYYYWGTVLMAKIATALDCAGDATHYHERREAIADAFNERYFDQSQTAYIPETQATQAVPLFLGLVPEQYTDAVAANLARTVRDEEGGQLRTGFLGTKALLPALTEYGYTDLAYRVVSQPEFPGWVYMLRQGATTIWERWDSDSEEHIGSGMNSLNHSPFTYVSEWFFDSLAGIDVHLVPSEEYRVDIAPAFVDDLDWIDGSVTTPCGAVCVRWETTDEDHSVAVDIDIEIPWNVVGRIRLPIDDCNRTISTDEHTVWTNGTVTDDLPAPIRSISVNEAQVTLEVTAGSYRLHVE